MKLKSLLASSIALAVLALPACQDKDLVKPGADPTGQPGVHLTVGLVQTVPVSRATDGIGLTDEPFREEGDPNENFIHKVHIIVTDTPVNDPGNGKVVRVITLDGFADTDNKNWGTDWSGSDVWQPINTQESLLWYDGSGNPHPVYESTSNLGHFRSYIASQVSVTDDQDLARHVEALATARGENTWLYAIALANLDLDEFVDASGTPHTIEQGMDVSLLRDLIYVGDLYVNASNEWFGYDPDDPDNTRGKFPWGPTGGGKVRFTDFAMSAINEVRFKPKFDSNHSFTFPTMMVQRLAARIDIAFGVQAVNEYTDVIVDKTGDGVTDTPDPANTTRYVYKASPEAGDHVAVSIRQKESTGRLPYIPDRGWFYPGDTNPRDRVTGPDGDIPAWFEETMGAGFIGFVNDIDDPDPSLGFVARALYDLDVTGDDNTTGYTNGAITDQTEFEKRNYTGQYRFPVYDEDTYLSTGKDVLISDLHFYMQSIRLTNCTNTGVYLLEQSKIQNGNNVTRRYLGNEGAWHINQNAYGDNFIYSTPMERRDFSSRQLTTLSDRWHRPVPCIQSGLRFPKTQRTYWSPLNTWDLVDGENGSGTKTKKSYYNRWGVYSILGYVGENTFETVPEPGTTYPYTGIHLAGVISTGSYFQDGEDLKTNDGNLRTPVAVSMKLVHNIGGGDIQGRGEPMHFGVVRNTIYRVYVKFYAKGPNLSVRYYYYNGRDGQFIEEPYKADFYRFILEDDSYHRVVD